MKTLGARWDIKLVEGGISIIYRNLKTGIIFNCGVCPESSPWAQVLQFIITEGDPGDFVYVEGQMTVQLQPEVNA